MSAETAREEGRAYRAARERERNRPRRVEVELVAMALYADRVRATSDVTPSHGLNSAQHSEMVLMSFASMKAWPDLLLTDRDDWRRLAVLMLKEKTLASF